MNIFIIVPAYNEQGRIGEFLKHLTACGYKIIVVDDGSSDNTANISQKYADYLIKHKINLGKGAAMETGAELAVKLKADAVIFMDADGQHLATDIRKFVEKLNEGYGIVYGSRIWNKSVPKERLLGNKAVSKVIKILFGTTISDIFCGFRALTIPTYKKIRWTTNTYGVETEMLLRAAKAKIKSCEVPISAVYLESYKGMTVGHFIELVFDTIRWRISL